MGAPLAYSERPKRLSRHGAAVVFFVFVFFGISAGQLRSIVGFVYLAFKSFEATENKVRGDNTQWPIYWVVYSFFSIIEVIVDFLLYRIPFCYVRKVVFLLWVMLQRTKGRSSCTTRF